MKFNAGDVVAHNYFREGQVGLYLRTVKGKEACYIRFEDGEEVFITVSNLKLVSPSSKLTKLIFGGLYES